MSEKILVDKEWLENILQYSEGCPFCGSMRKFIINKTKGFYDRKGCLDCNKWFSGYRLNGEKCW